MNQSTQRIIRNKIGLLNLAEELGNVSKACRMMGVSRDTFYRCQTARDDGGVEALLEKSRRKPNPKNRVEPQIEQAVLESNELRKQGVFVSPSGVRSIWLRHTPQSRKLRIKALARSRASGASTRRPLSTRTARRRPASCTRRRHRSRLRIFSTIACCRCSRTTASSTRRRRPTARRQTASASASTER